MRAHKKKGVDDDKPKQTAEMEARIGKDGCALIKKKTARIRKEKRLHKKRQSLKAEIGWICALKE